MGKGIDLSGLSANVVNDTLADIIAQKMLEQDRATAAEDRRLNLERQARLDAQAAEERTVSRRRLADQDERQRRLDDEAREGKLAKEAVEMATLFPGKIVSGETMKRVPKYLHELIATPKDAQLASRSIGGVAVAGDPNAGDIDIEQHQAVAPDSYELQLPVSERARLAAERQAAAETKRQADERFRQEKLDRETQHRERMAEIAATRAAGGGAGTFSAGTKEDIDALATMVESNPDLLKNLAPKDRGVILRRIAGRGTNRLRNQRADSARTSIDTALESIRRLRGDDPTTGARGAGAPGFSGAFGARNMSSLYGILDKPIAGTEAADATALLNTLRSQITRPQLEAMRGMGALSDRDVAMLTTSASTLDSSLREETALAELDRLEKQLLGARAKLPADLESDIIVDDPRQTSSSPAARPSAPDRSGGLDGMIARPGAGSQRRVGDVVNVGGRRVRITKLYANGTFDGEAVR